MKKTRIAAAALALAMTVSAAPAGMMLSASAAAPSVAQTQDLGPYREVYGDLNGLYYDRALMFDASGTLVVENPMPTSRSFQDTAFPFSLNYNSQSTRDNGFGVGVSNTYMQSVVHNQDGTYTYYDSYDFPHILYYNENYQYAVDDTGEIEMTLTDRGYSITYKGDTMEFDSEHGMIYLIYQHDKMDGIGIYRNEEGRIDYVRAKDATHYDFIYTTDDQGNTRVSGLQYYMIKNGAVVNSQELSFAYNADGRLVDITNHFDNRGYTYQFDENNRLTDTYNKMIGGMMHFRYNPINGNIVDTAYVPGN